MEEALLETFMPKMILQPIVENYFKHGFNHSRSDGFVEITAAKLGDKRMEICIQNNGNAIPSAKLDLLRQKLQHSTRTDIDLLRNTEQDKEATGSGIGLPNVLARLKLVCGDSAILTVDNLRAGGVVVRLEIDIIAERETI
ncbi:Sensor histidine kinase YpdA [compost metagenome]